ncbi:hypothetical protein D3C78_1362250 [compost metagenome]
MEQIARLNLPNLHIKKTPPYSRSSLYDFQILWCKHNRIKRPYKITQFPLLKTVQLSLLTLVRKLQLQIYGPVFLLYFSRNGSIITAKRNQFLILCCTMRFG